MRDLRKTIAHKRATLKRVGWQEGARAYWNRLLLRMSGPESIGTKHENGLTIRFYRSARFHTPEQFNKMGIETYDVALGLEGNVAVDIGAHYGAYALRLAKNFRHVYAFEPDPDTFQLLRENIRDNKIQNITAERKAVSDSSGMKTFRTSSKFLTAGTLESSHYDWLGHDGAFEVEAVSLDEYFERGIGKIDFVKIDVENHELSVLNGMTKMVKKHHPIMSVEIHKHPTDLAYCLCNICERLREQGLDVQLHGVYAEDAEAHWVIAR